MAHEPYGTKFLKDLDNSVLFVELIYSSGVNNREQKPIIASSFWSPPLHPNSIFQREDYGIISFWT